jgi:hypothetical protein
MINELWRNLEKRQAIHSRARGCVDHPARARDEAALKTGLS